MQSVPYVGMCVDSELLCSNGQSIELYKLTGSLKGERVCLITAEQWAYSGNPGVLTLSWGMIKDSLSKAGVVRCALTWN